MSWTILIAGAMLAQAPLVDLVADAPKQGAERHVTYRFGGRSFHTPKPKPRVELAVEIESGSIRPGAQPVAIILMTIRNIGPAPYPLPIGRDADVVLAPKNRGRREVHFLLSAPGGRQPVIYGSSTFGSPDAPGSELVIPPGGAVRVRFLVHLEGKTENQVGAGFEEWRYDDDPTHYAVDTTDALKVFSKNSVELRVPSNGAGAEKRTRSE